MAMVGLRRSLMLFVFDGEEGFVVGGLDHFPP